MYDHLAYAKGIMLKISKDQSGFGVLEGLLILVIVAIVSFVGWYILSVKHSVTKTYSVTSSSTQPAKKPTTSPTKKVDAAVTQPSNFVLPSGWSWYMNSTYGFKIGYPDAWGTPRGTDFSAGKIGGTYDTSWFLGGKYLINIRMDSQNSVFQGCNDSGNCTEYGSTNTKSAYSPVIKQIEAGDYSNSTYALVAHDAFSYETLLGNSVLDSYRITDILKINSTAAYGEYEVINPSDSCLHHQVSPNTEQGCITQELANNFSDVMSSIQPL